MNIEWHVGKSRSMDIEVAGWQDGAHSDLVSIFHNPTTYLSLMNNKSLPICSQLQNGVSLEPEITKTSYTSFDSFN